MCTCMRVSVFIHSFRVLFSFFWYFTYGWIRSFGFHFNSWTPVDAFGKYSLQFENAQISSITQRRSEKLFEMYSRSVRIHRSNRVSVWERGKMGTQKYTSIFYLNKRQWLFEHNLKRTAFMLMTFHREWIHKKINNLLKLLRWNGKREYNFFFSPSSSSIGRKALEHL